MSQKLSIEEGRKILHDGATHRQIQDAVEQYLSVQGIRFSSTDAAEAFNRRGQRIRRVTPGWPDISACLAPEGLFFPIEVKTADDTLRPSQAECLHSLYLSGALVYIARSVDDVIETRRTRRIRQCDIDEICKALQKARRPKKRRVKVSKKHGTRHKNSMV